MMLKNIERIALYVAFYAIGFGISAVVSKDFTGSLLMSLILGIGIGSADVLIHFADSFTDFGMKLISNAYYMIGMFGSCIVAYGLFSFALWGRDLLTMTTWVSAVSFIFIVMCPFFVNAVMRVHEVSNST